MNNPNALIALAYIKTNNNPLQVFCSYIHYLLTVSPNGSLRADELNNKLQERFGLEMPQSMITSCIRILKKQDRVKILPKGGGYALDQHLFDAKSFDEEMIKLGQHEAYLLKSIIEFIDTKYKIKWTVEEAKNVLSQFLDEEGNGVRIFLDEELETKKVHKTWYIGRYISSLQNLIDSPEKTFLEEIVNGMMIYQGIYQTNDYQQDKNQKFKGTTFFLDTKLILRIMGFSLNEHITVANELISMIKNDCGGKIGIFTKTLSEVEKALMDAHNSVRKNKRIDDFELRMWAELNPSEVSLLDISSLSVQKILESKFDIHLFEGIDWNDPTNQHNVIDSQKIIEFIFQNKNWRKGAITNDVDIIQQINILRKGNYTTDYGGKNKLPVFITSNKDLVYCFKEYVKNEYAKEDTSTWNKRNLPIISDDMITARLWVPRAKKYSNIPSLTLAKFAYSAQLPTSNFFAKLKEIAEGYKNSHYIDILDIDEERKKILEDILVEKTHGDSDNLTEEIVAIGADEFARIQNISLVNENLDLKEKSSNDESIIKQQATKINKLCAEKYVNKIGLGGRILILSAKAWWIITSIITAFLLLNLDFLLGTIPIPSYSAVFITPIIELIFTLLDKYSEKKDLQNFLVKKAITYEWTIYTNKIRTKLSNEHDIDIDWVINYCLEHTPIFCKYSKYCIVDN